MEFNISKHTLVPKHVKLNPEEKEKLLNKYNISTKQLAVIIAKDAAIQHLGVKKGDVIKIVRDSPTVGKSEFYRVVR
jgi:DNA-directed RNA polymerase subunit H (RpoH/RPB5)